MLNLLKTSLGRLRVIGFLEGISFLLLLGVAMPLKYWYDQPEMVTHTGRAHGLLFVLYIVLVIQVAYELNWNWKKVMLALAASVIPFGTFYADAKLFKN
jgi:integral membrane protein